MNTGKGDDSGRTSQDGSWVFLLGLLLLRCHKISKDNFVSNKQVSPLRSTISRCSRALHSFRHMVNHRVNKSNFF